MLLHIACYCIVSMLELWCVCLRQKALVAPPLFPPTPPSTAGSRTIKITKKRSRENLGVALHNSIYQLAKLSHYWPLLLSNIPENSSTFFSTVDRGCCIFSESSIWPGSFLILLRDVSARLTMRCWCRLHRLSCEGTKLKVEAGPKGCQLEAGTQEACYLLVQ